MGEYNLKHVFGGSFVSIVEMGATYGVGGANTVGLGQYPSDAADWFKLGNCMDSVIEPKTKTTSIVQALAEGGHWEKEINRNMGQLLKFNLEYLSEPLDRIIFGLKSKIVNGTAQTAFGNTGDWAIYCWLNFQLRVDGGVDRHRIAVPGMLRMDANPKWAVDQTLPAVKFEVYKSPIASDLPSGVA